MDTGMCAIMFVYVIVYRYSVDVFPTKLHENLKYKDYGSWRTKQHLKPPLPFEFTALGEIKAVPMVIQVAAKKMSHGVGSGRATRRRRKSS